jgi:predicted  nucleic acid-binding Zn-ribbon protein
MSISPNVPNPQESYRYEEPGTPRWIAALFVVLFLAVGAMGFYNYNSQAKLTQDLAKADDTNKQLIQRLDQANSKLADLKGHIEVTEEKLGMTQAELAKAKSRAESIRKDQLAADEKLTTQLTQVQKESEEKIGAVATDLGGAKKDLETTKNDLESTKGKLERMQGDEGVMSGLIARNHDDLEELKRRGERNYYEFTVPKTKTPQRVGPVQITLNKLDQKKNKYTVTVFADDKSIEKKDKTAGEPVQFYVKGSSRMAPYEMVVFDVGKNQITGYLSTPKDTSAASAAPAATSKP